MQVVCTILVVFALGKVNFLQNEQVQGTIISYNSYNYLVDFSKEAKEKEYLGDYSKKLVDRKNCIEIK